MTQQSSQYKNISCSYYDRLEEYATKRTHCSIVYRVDDKEQFAEGVITDVFTKESAEYLQLNNGTIIRLDLLISINGIPVSTVC